MLEPRRSVFGGSLDQSGQKMVARGMSEHEPPSTVIARYQPGLTYSFMDGQFSTPKAWATSLMLLVVGGQSRRNLHTRFFLGILFAYPAISSRGLNLVSLIGD